MLTKHAGAKIFSVFSCDEKVLNHYKVFHFNRKKTPIHPRFWTVKISKFHIDQNIPLYSISIIQGF